MPRLSKKTRKQLERLANKPDKEIDFSDIPKIGEIPADAVIGRFYKPRKTR